MPETGDQIQLDSQFCGGYIDPNSLDAIGFIQLNGNNADLSKGYICPLGQICKASVIMNLSIYAYLTYVQEQENPSNNVESFDAIHYAALQVVIVASANGVSGFHLTFG